jgi:hypothetical protein
VISVYARFAAYTTISTIATLRLRFSSRVVASVEAKMPRSA